MKFFVVLVLLTLAALFALVLFSAYAYKTSQVSMVTPRMNWVEEVNIPPPGSHLGLVALDTIKTSPAGECSVWSVAGDGTTKRAGGVGVNDRLKIFSKAVDSSPVDVLVISLA